MKPLNQIKIVVICVLVALLARADTGKLYNSSMLSSSKTDCIVQDRYGYLWVGTEYGLNRFDGYRFTSYFYDANDSTSIVNNEINDFLVDSSGRLWIGCGKGLVRYDYENNKFIRYKFPDGQTPRVRMMIEDSEGNILFGTDGYGLYSIRPGADALRVETDMNKRSLDNFYTRVFEDERHNLWRGSHIPVVTRMKVNGLKPTASKDFTTNCGSVVNFLKSDRSGFYVVCTNGILRYDYEKGTMSNAGFDLSALGSKASIGKAMLDRIGNIYIGTSGKGVMMIPRGSKTLQVMEASNSDFNLATANVNDIYEDKDRNIWLSCYEKGLFQLNTGTEAFSSWLFSAQDYVLGSSVSSIAAGNEGDIWCTVQKSGVYRFDRNGKITAHPSSPVGPNTIYKDKQGKYWLCTENELYSYNPYTGESAPKISFDGLGLNCMTDNGEGVLYICNYSKGLCIYDTNTSEVKMLSMADVDSKKGFLANDWIRSLYMDSRGLLWIGTADGYSCYNPADGNFRIFGWDYLLRGLQGQSICENSNGDMLLGTSAGLYIFHRKENKLSLFHNSEVLRNNSIYSIITDNGNDLWLSTANGIWQYNSRAKKFIAHINGNGLNTKEYILGAGLKLANGQIAFGINDGITVFYPKNVSTMRLAMDEVYLTNFSMNGRSINCLTDEFTLPYDENTFSMEFSLLNFKNTANITFQYNISGSKEWVALPEGSNVLSFNKLKPGEYKIKVRAENNGIYSKKTKNITITIKDPWYASTLAYLAYFILAIGIVFFMVVLYERRRKEELEEAKMRFLINATHDIRSPLTLIMGPLSKLKNKITDEDSLSYIDIIDRNARRLMLLVNQILDERKIDKNQMHLHRKQTDLVKFINGVYSLYKFNAGQRNITLEFKHADNELLAYVDKINFEKVISNLLSNAFKYTFDGGNVTIELSHNDTEATIAITDSGIGFKDEEKDHLFDRFYQGRHKDGFHIEGTGIGLNLSRSIVLLHNGSITAHNRTDGHAGACLEITIPLSGKYLTQRELEEINEVKEENHGVKRHANRNFHILVVDDDEEIANYIKDELSDWYRFDIAGNGKEALSALLSGKYDLVISDVMMPEMDGITLLKNIKTNTRISDIPVILLTSKAEVSDRLEGFKKGADGFIAKPFNMEELHILIDNLIDNVRRLRGKYSGAQQQEDKVEKVEVKGNNDVLMERIMKCINENISDAEFNVERLSESVGISRAQLHRKMKEMTGISTGDFIRNLRLEQAARLIREGKINVTQVAYTVGFNNQTHFSTVFKRHFGVSPTEYAEGREQVEGEI